MSSRNQPPPGNLKERIAALQQRNVSPTPASPAAAVNVPNSAGLRDKIARFERKGGTPVPRGSFGLGAPPPPENGPEKRRGELYGNRIPSAAKIPTGSQPGSRAASPFDTTRSFSLSVIEGENPDLLQTTNGSPTSPVSPFLGSTIEHKKGEKPTPRGTAWGSAVEMAKQAELRGEILPSSRNTSSPAVGADNGNTAPVSDAPIAGVVSGEQVKTNGLDIPTTILNSPTTPLMESPTATSPPPSQAVHKVEPAATIEQPAPVVLTEEPKPIAADASPAIPQVNIQPPAEAASTAKATSKTAQEVNKALEVPTIVAPPSETTSSTNDLTPMASPIGPFSLANAVQDLGKVVANIQDMFPGQISPLTSPLPYRSFRGPDAPQTAAPVQSGATKSEVPKTAAPAVAASKGQTTKKPNGTSSNLLATPRSTAARPNTMFETSPTQAPQVSRGTGQPHPSTLGQKNYEHFPPTPSAAVDEFGAVTGSGSAHQKSRSISESSSKPATFTAKVYKKVTELPSVPAASSTSSFYSSLNASTPKPEASALPEISLLSPGFGELSSLLQDAALLEFTLGQGDISAEAPKKDEREEKAKETEAEKKGKEQARNQTPVPAPPATESNVAPSTASTTSVNRSKSSTSIKGGRTTPTRSRTLNGPRPSQSSISVASARESTLDTSSAASQTSPKSPKGYFSSIRRLASSSKTSVNTTASGHPRYSASTASEASTEDNYSIIAPPGLEVSVTPSDDPKEATKSPTQNGVSSSGSSVLSPKKSPMSRAASFAGSMFSRSRTKSTNAPVVNPYEAIDRIAKNKVNKSAAALIPPIESPSTHLELPGSGPASPPDRLVSPRRHSSLYTTTTSFEPNFSTRPVSSVWGNLPSPQGPPSVPPPATPVNIDALFAAKPTSPIYTAGGKKSEETEVSLDAAFAADITSSVYIPPSPHPPQSKAPSTRTTGTAASSRSFLPLSPMSPSEGSEADVESPGGMSLLPSPNRPPSLLPSPNRPPSLLPSPNRPPSYMSGDEPDSGLPTPLYDSFPSVPVTAPAVPPKTPVSAAPASAATTSGRAPRPLPSLPMRSASFFDSAPISSAVGSEFMPSATLPARSATVREQRR